MECNQTCESQVCRFQFPESCSFFHCSVLPRNGLALSLFENGHSNSIGEQTHRTSRYQRVKIRLVREIIKPPQFLFYP